MKRQTMWQQLSEDFRTYERADEIEPEVRRKLIHFTRRMYGGIEIPVFPLVEMARIVIGEPAR